MAGMFKFKLGNIESCRFRKTTGQDRLATFFEQLGWKVFTVPEAATILLGGGVKFGELSAEQGWILRLKRLT